MKISARGDVTRLLIRSYPNFVNVGGLAIDGD
jgi:hypothetical protein